MQRRAFLKTSGTAAMGVALAGCAPRIVSGAAASASPRRRTVNLVPVDASWDRVIRTTVGLRPHRDSGFVVRAEQMDDKTVIQLRAWRRGDVALVGNCFARDGVGACTIISARRGHWLRNQRTHGRASASASRLRRHDLRRRVAAGNDVQHVLGRLHTALRFGVDGSPNAGMGRAISSSRGHRVSRASTSCWATVRRFVDRGVYDDVRSQRASRRVDV